MPRRRETAHADVGVGPHGAVFLDRDGVITTQGTHVNRPDDLELVDGAGPAIARLNRAGIRVVVVTNQGGIALGHLTEETLGAIHDRMRRDLARDSARVDAIYYCPHHERATVTAYLAECSCRKPGTAMLERARDELGIDLRESVIVGDSTSDILAGIRAGCATILVRTGFGGEDGKCTVEPDAIIDNLPAAVDRILVDRPTTRARTAAAPGA